MTIWINEQIDSCGIIQACIAGYDQQAAEECHRDWEEKLTLEQEKQGWKAVIRSVSSWDDVPVNALKLS